MDRCSVEEPVMRDVGGGHRVSCHLYSEGLPVSTNPPNAVGEPEPIPDLTPAGADSGDGSQEQA